ncbi:c-type cytochrome [Malikia granosa]|uniref:Cytochrome c domain-containing protein n=1 Tax=Malikia granosa TaxID=263067 RepID=A0A2S9K164_9BURK|nr:c-type cytochrome [Malikia granosa]PRD64186.1 hypothetical protein C6P64_15725 [Malikia granosa]
MKKTPIAALVLASAALAPALAAEIPDLAQAKQCLGCHSVDRDALAPSLRNIGTKYRKVRQAESIMVEIITKGSPLLADGKHWGAMKMPGAGTRVPVSEAEARQLADWILAL